MKSKGIGISILIGFAALVLGFDTEYIKDYVDSDIYELIENVASSNNVVSYTSYDIDSIPDYSEELYVVINDNVPSFDESDYSLEAFAIYSELDYLERVGTAYGKLGYSLMPTEDRTSISSVTPSGWINVSYDFVDGGYLYNRSHLFGFQLTGENANKLNLMTGTRTFNTKGMLPFENMIADYIKETNNHVMYRVTPVYEGNNLVAKGILMEAYSVEDNGDGIMFNVFVYNNEPGVVINYATGESSASE